ncbi:probable carboxylesterase 15 [Rhododendron vialii]|uniref:probable carboxylesterase 15 n=1 Tax=Rhododendron vialii TaxID=182163 RepID=UPI00265E7BB0|nr:probable carboxylesterase 15 [Rhododendron vialii]
MGSLPHPHIVEDCQGILQLYSDGSITRSDINLRSLFNNNPPNDDDDVAASSVLFKDCLYHKPHHLRLRLYKPKNLPSSLPVLLFLHGGGFCVGSRTWPNFHNCCLRLSSALRAVVVSPDYRLAPEHRLPAAIDDALAALEWVRAQATSENPEPWLGGGAVDFGKVFVLGDSSGGNIAHHLAVRFGSGFGDLEPVRVRGFVLMAPFFGGCAKTKSEAEGPPEPLLNLEILDRFWRLSIPVGETADHPFANPFGPRSPNLEPVMLDPILAIVGGREVLKDRVEDYARRLKEMGKKIEYVEFEGQHHGFFINEPYSDTANRVLQLLTSFMDMNSN